MSDLHAIVNSRNAGLAHWLPVFQQVSPERYLSALREPIVIEPLGVLQGGGGPRWSILVLQPQDSETSRTNEIPGLSICFVGQVDHKDGDSLLFFFACSG